MTVGVHGYHTTFQDPHGVRRDFSRAPRPSCRPSCRTWKPRVYALAKGKADSSKKEDERGAPHDKPHQGGLTASLLFNAASWRAQRGQTHCITCQGKGQVQCPQCKGTGVGPRSRQPTNPIQHAANKISSLVSGGKADDVEWRTSNRCSRCQGRGVCRCEECGGTGRRGPSEEES
ncbi:hypothetical protein ACKKBG_A01900 [Auxenochlorella protothecoides x Auxenochlorella symbiontica]